MKNIEQLIANLDKLCVAEKLLRIATLQNEQTDILLIVSPEYIIKFDGHAELNGYVVNHYSLHNRSVRGCISRFVEYYYMSRLIRVTYSFNCLKEEKSMDVLYDFDESIEHARSVIVSMCYENLIIARVNEL